MSLSGIPNFVQTYFTIDTIQYLCSSLMGTTEVSDVVLADIYPNPFSYSTTLETNIELKNATLIIYNAYGQIENEIKKLFGKVVIFNRENLKAGLYFICLRQDNKIIMVKKITITD